MSKKVTKADLEKEIKHQKSLVNKFEQMFATADINRQKAEKELKEANAKVKADPKPFSIIISGLDGNKPNELTEIELDGISNHFSVIALKIATVSQEIRAEQA